MEAHNSGVPGDPVTSVEADQAERRMEAAAAKGQPKRKTLRERLWAWLRGSRLVTARNLTAIALHVRVIAVRSSRLFANHEALINGLRADLEATQELLKTTRQELAEARGETVAVENFLNVYRMSKDLRGHYELARIPRSLRAKKLRRRS